MENQEKIIASIDWAITHLTRAKLAMQLMQPYHGHLQAAQDNLSTVEDLLPAPGLTHGRPPEDPNEGAHRGPATYPQKEV